MTKTLKAQYAADVFTTPSEAKSRSVDLGLGGEIFVTDYDGQAVYMPGSSEEQYLSYYEDLGDIPSEGGEEYSRVDRLEALRVVIQEIMKKEATIEGQIAKFDEEQRIVYGWASVVTEKGVPVIDRQNDVIEPDTLVKAVNSFMENVRVGKSMHTGDPIGMVLHSLPVTDEIAKSLGIQSEREGWIVAFKVYDDKVWADVKSGKLAAFSIGGRAIKEDYNG